MASDWIVDHIDVSTTVRLPSANMIHASPPEAPPRAHQAVVVNSIASAATEPSFDLAFTGEGLSVCRLA